LGQGKLNPETAFKEIDIINEEVNLIEVVENLLKEKKLTF
jgi:hypothetical protein